MTKKKAATQKSKGGGGSSANTWLILGAVVIAAGIGAFPPRRLPQACAEPWYGRGIYDVVTDPDEFKGQKVVIIGGGDTAFDWGVQLLPRASRVTIVHRTDRFRAHDATVNEYKAAVEAAVIRKAEK